MKKSALLVWGGWLGHSPKACTELFGPWLEEQGYEVEISDTLDAYLDLERLSELSLIVRYGPRGRYPSSRRRISCGRWLAVSASPDGTAAWATLSGPA